MTPMIRQVHRQHARNQSIHLACLLIVGTAPLAEQEALHGGPAPGALIYYVSPAGNDANPGTSPAKAWRTVSRVNHFSFGPGASVLFEGGQTFSGGLLFGRDDQGTPAAPITVGSYGSGRATILAGKGDGIHVHNTGGFNIANLNVSGSGLLTNSGSGIYFNNDLTGNVKLRHVRVDQVEVNGFGKNGISVEANKGNSGFSDVRITRAVAHDNALAGIAIAGESSDGSKAYANEDVYIGYSKAYNNPGISGRDRDNSGSGIVISEVDRGTIERSVAYGNGRLCNSTEGGPVGIWAWDSNQIVIQYNESYGNKAGGEYDGGGFDLDGGVTNSVMQYNYSHDNDGPGYLLTQIEDARPFAKNTIRYNISQNDGRKNGYAAIHLFSESGEIRPDKAIYDTDIYNNTVYMSASTADRGAAIFVDENSTAELRVRNNIFQTRGEIPIVEVVKGQKGLLFQGNDYFSIGGHFEIKWLGVTYKDLGEWRAATGQERADGRNVGLSVDPRLRAPGGGGALNNAELTETLDAYRLQGGSTLIAAGLDLSRLFRLNPGSRDYYGGPLPGRMTFAVGAHEYAANPGAPPSKE